MGKHIHKTDIRHELHQLRLVIANRWFGFIRPKLRNAAKSFFLNARSPQRKLGQFLTRLIKLFTRGNRNDA